MSKKQIKALVEFRRGLKALRQKRLKYAVRLLNRLWDFYNGDVDLIYLHLSIIPPPFEIVVDFQNFTVSLA